MRDWRDMREGLRSLSPLALQMGSHYEDKDQECHPRAVQFTDYASAGNEWSGANRYRVWLPALIRGRMY